MVDSTRQALGHLGNTVNITGSATETTLTIQPGRVLDFIDGSTQRLETPEEYVRQEIAKSLVREYGYPRDSIRVEYGIKSGSKKPRLDLAIFEAGSASSQATVRLIVECKSFKVKPSDKGDGIGQLQSYLASCINAEYGMWTNGLERLCFRKRRDGEGFRFDEIPDLPPYGAAGDDAERPKFDQLKAASSDALLFAFRRCHNYIAGNQGLQKPEAFWELLKLIFCKIHDERGSDEVQFYVTSKERGGLTGVLKAKLRAEQLFDKVKAEYSTIFKPSDKIELEGPVCAYLMSQLQMYSLLESDVDVKGRAYEEIVGSNLRGDRGEFFTPRNICKMAVAMLDPTEADVILDPACGTGGFLITAMNHVIEKLRVAELKKWGEIERAETAIRERVSRFAASRIIGIDLNPNLVKAAKMNMVMNNDGTGGLYQANSLRSPAVWDEALRRREIFGSIDKIFTNPPFGSKIPIDDFAILERFQLGHVWDYDRKNDLWSMRPEIQKSQPPEILFIELCVKLLKPGGRAALILPDGILGSPGLGYVREWILSNARILASIDLHPDTFQPHVSVQTSLLILEKLPLNSKGLPEPRGDYEVFMALAEHIGHDKRGNVTYVRDKAGNEIVQELVETTKEYVDGKPSYKEQKVMRKVVDDNTLQIAKAFCEWLSEQD